MIAYHFIMSFSYKCVFEKHFKNQKWPRGCIRRIKSFHMRTVKSGAFTHNMSLSFMVFLPHLKWPSPIFLFDES